MAIEPFIQPKFTGPRFEEHTLPLSAARDLAAYEELVVELAKHLYLSRNSDRRRVPKGFVDGFHLHLQRVDDGCAKPLLALVTEETLISALPQEFTQARDLINKVIGTPDGEKPPAEFPKEFYAYFNRIGRSLEAGDALEWAPENPSNRSVLTPEKRKRLALKGSSTYEAETAILGQVIEVNTERCEGRLRSEGNDEVTFEFGKPLFSELKEALGRRDLTVRIGGVGIFDRSDRLKSIKEIENLEILPHYALTSAVDKLNGMQDGWLEGGGTAAGVENLSTLSKNLVEFFPSEMPYPGVVPTEEGNVGLEWVRPAARIELEVNFADRRLELYATDLNTDGFVEECFSWEEWPQAFEKISALI